MELSVEGGEDMELGPGEVKVAECFVKEPGDATNIMTLTDRRLNIRCGRSEEDYPLSKITAVKTNHRLLWWLVIPGVLLIAVGIFMFGQRQQAIARLDEGLSTYRSQEAARREAELRKSAEAAALQQQAQGLLDKAKALLGLAKPKPAPPPIQVPKVNPSEIPEPPWYQEGIRGQNLQLELSVGAPVVGAILAVIGLVGERYLEIRQLGGTKPYRLYRKDPQVEAFVSELVKRLT